MQFVLEGPDVPDELLQAHEEGKVVFFCGAGVAYKVGLKDFQWLVDQIFRACGTDRSETEDQTYENCQFDLTLNSLEDRLPGRRHGQQMRRALAQALRPRLRRKGATDTHNALLQLGRVREGALRLVTTNFDRTFEKVIKRHKIKTTSFSAPMLPVPKSSQWDGLVYLHGLIPDNLDNKIALDRLVVTSGDFGLAYLTERWAARFVSELFRNYVVCFVGYSLGDPVLRYMMDALAADRLRGEATPRAYVMTSCQPGEEEKKTKDWKSRGLVPVLYDPKNHHRLLHETLKVWASDYSLGVGGKERIIVQHALSNPSESTQQDDFVGRMLWALSDKGGLPAKRFAELNPAPPLTWLEAFADNRFGHDHLPRFEVTPHSQPNAKLRFSLIDRPPPYNRAPRMQLVSMGCEDAQWDDVMFYLARWLLRHVNDPALVLWVAEQGDRLTNEFSRLLRIELERSQHQHPQTDLDAVLEGSERLRTEVAPRMQCLWNLLLAGRMRSSWRERDIYGWTHRLKSDGLTLLKRLELREILAPRIALRRALDLSWNGSEVSGEIADDRDAVNRVIDWELVLAANHVRVGLPKSDDESWNEVLPQLMGDFQQLLLDGLGLLQELGEVDVWSDRSFLHLPSICPHWQNRGYRDWMVLVELLRDSWRAMLKRDPVRASRVAQDWFDIPFPVFKRLALFAASHDGCVPPNKWATWLVADDSWWLWSAETQRETMRLLVSQGSNLSKRARTRLEGAILAGPPRRMYRENVDLEWWNRFVRHSVAIMLAKLAHEEEVLRPTSRARLREQFSKEGQWQKARSNERHEFPVWSSGTGDPDFEDSRKVDIPPENRQELTEWLRKPVRDEFAGEGNQWRDMCRTRFPRCLAALLQLARDEEWPSDHWRVALQVWSDESLILRSLRWAGPTVEKIPSTTLRKVVHSLAWWVETASRSTNQHLHTLMVLCHRIIDQDYEENEEEDEPVNRAINHPIGLATRALINIWFKEEPSDNETLPANIKAIFTHLCDTDIRKFRHARVILASRLVVLFRVDRSWASNYLLPILDWSLKREEARGAWKGFLWSPRGYPALLVAIKPNFLETAAHYWELGEHGKQFVRFLTFAALDPIESYESTDFRAAFGVLPKEALEDAADALLSAQQGAGEQTEEYWRKRILGFWQEVWPKSQGLNTNQTAELLARMAIAARGEFSAALAEVIDWLRPVESCYSIVRDLNEEKLCSRFPESSLTLLNAIVDESTLLREEARQCLVAIEQACPSLRNDHRFRRLDEYLRRRDL